MRITSSWIIFLSLLTITLPANGQKKDTTVLVYGTIRNYKNVIEIVDKDYTEPFQIINSKRSFAPDGNGSFSIEFTLNQPTYFRLARNYIYLVPGDKLKADIDYTDAKNSTFKGDRSQENEYLKSIPYPKAGSFLEGGQNVKSSVDETFFAMLDLAKQRRKLLSDYKELLPEFRYLEQNRINADLLNSFYALRSYYIRVHKLKGDSLSAFNIRFPVTVDSFARKYVPITANAKLMKLEVYRDVAQRIIRLKDSMGKEVAKINDWFYAKQVVHELQTASGSFNVKRINSIKTTEYRNAVLQMYNELISLNGTSATDITLTDLEGKKIQLSSLKGKVIYIDIWATWCVPCIKEQPYLDSLRDKFNDDSKIAILSLSIDRDTSDWVNYINKKKLIGFQYITDLDALSSYHLTEIPRTILIDKNFNIHAMRGPMPSSSEVINILQAMLLH